MKLYFILPFILFMGISTVGYSQKEIYTESGERIELLVPSLINSDIEKDNLVDAISSRIVGGNEGNPEAKYEHKWGPETPTIRTAGNYSKPFIYTAPIEDMDFLTNGYLGYSGKDVIYTVTLEKAMDLDITVVSTHIYLTNVYVVRASDFSLILRQTDRDLAQKWHINFSINNLSAGTYYVIVETNIPEARTQIIIQGLNDIFYETGQVTSLGIYNENFKVSPTMTTRTNGYEGLLTSDITYRIELRSSMDITISPSIRDIANIYILDKKYSLIGRKTSLFNGITEEDFTIEHMPPGVYYIIIEPCYLNNISTTTTIQGVKSDYTPYIIDIGTFNTSFDIYETINTNNTTNAHQGKTTNDVFYKFTINFPMQVEVTNCGSEIDDTLLYLLDENFITLYEQDKGETLLCSNNELAYMYISWLEPGTYYIVSEGYFDNGVIHTRIWGRTFLEDPYIVNLGTFNTAFDIEQKINTTNTTNAYEGKHTNEVYYKFTITNAMQMEVTNCGSEIDDTLLYLLDENFITLYEQDKGETLLCSNNELAYMYISWLEPGTYYIVSEGYFDNGVIHTRIWGTPYRMIMEVGTKSSDFYYSNIIDTKHTGDSYGRSTNDIFYKMTLSRAMDIVISHCGSEIDNTYLYLLNASMETLDYNNGYSGIEACGKTTQAYLKKENLAAGTYYIVSEGYNQNGKIATTIEGYSRKTLPNVKTASSTENYIQTLQPLVPSTSTSSLSLGECMQTVQYFDGLGKPTQTVQVGITPSGGNLVTHIEYDAFGRVSKEWIPTYVSATNANIIKYFGSDATSFYGDSNPYTEFVYDNPIQNRVTMTTGPGNYWHSAKKGVEQEYLFNTESGELCANYYTLDSDEEVIKDGTYPAGELFVEKTTDEDGKSNYVFTNKLGQIVQQRQMNGEEAHNTHYVYDRFGRLRYVLPPMMDESITPEKLANYAYSYRYDSRGNCIEKKLPGAEPIHYIYDKANRLILSQDGNQRARVYNLWTITKYDQLGRVIYTGEGKFGTHPFMLNYWNDYVLTESFSMDPHTYPMSNSGYSKSWYHLVDIRLLTVYYYDNYDFISLLPSSTDRSALAYTTKSGYSTQHTNATGMLTGMRVYDSMDGNIYTTTAYYYDDKGNEVQVKSTNFLANGIEKNYYKRGFTGNVEFHLKENTATGKETISELYEYRYDHGLRVKNVIHQINNHEKVVMATNEYDELGRLKTKALHGSFHTTNYEYNIRGWITDINGQAFTQKLSYRTYNGNITVNTWKVSSEGFKRRYVYEYDGLNRLTKATYGEINGSSDLLISPNDRYSLYIDQYDKQGNIQKVKRRGAYLPYLGSLTGSAPPIHPHIGVIDDLTMTYNGNQLIKVVDEAKNDPVYNEVMHFSSRFRASTQYYYDSNGNRVRDMNKGITNTIYNLMNQPTTIYFYDQYGHDGFDWIEYKYDAAGKKYKASYAINKDPFISAGIVPTTTYTEYCGNLIYKNNKLHKILTQEGYIELGSNNKFTYYYHIKDYQGNNCVVIKQNLAALQQVNHYYPFGALFGDNRGTSDQTYKYGGKELERMLGLDTYDFHARRMSPISFDFDTPDPLAEKYYEISPYAYCANNPILYVDPDGKKIVIGNAIGRFFAYLGIKNFEWTVQRQLEQLKAMDPILNEAIEKMEKSETIIRINPKLKLGGKDDGSMAQQQSDGSVSVFLDGKTTSVNGRYRPTIATFAHELGHVDDILEGKRVLYNKREVEKGNKEEIKKGNMDEANAIFFENTVYEKLNINYRRSYNYYEIYEK